MFRTRRLRTVTYNGHVGIAFRNGALPFLARHGRFDVAFLQECRNVADVKRDLPPSKWHYAPVEQPRKGTTYVVARKRRFDLLGVENLDVTFGEQHERRLVVATLRDKRTRRVVVATSLHVAPLGQGFEHAHPGARARHEKQVQAYADRMAEVPVGAVAVLGGDVNERLWQDAGLPRHLRERSVVGRMAEAGLLPTFKVAGQGAGLDEIFFRPDPYVRLVKRERVEVPVKGGDHPAVKATFRIRKAKRKRGRR